MTIEEIESLARWSAPKEVVTKRGDRILRKTRLTPELEKVWQSRRKEFVEAGISRSEFDGRVELCWWQEVPTAVIEARAQRVEQSRAVDADVAIPAPAGLTYKGYQKAGIAFALASFKQYGGCLIADDMGLGKTIQGLGIINAEPKIQRVLIVSPNTLKLNWYREAKRWLTRRLSIGIADAQVFPSTDIVICNYEICYKYEKSLSFYWDLIILDESHRVKNPKTRVAKSILGYRPTPKEREAGMEASSAIPTRRKLALTGTPIQNRPIEIWPILNWIAPDRWRSISKFATRYCGASAFNRWSTKGATNTEDLQRELRSTVLIRRLKQDVLTELPAKQRQIIVLPADGLEGLLREERQIAARWEPKLQELRRRVEEAERATNTEQYAAAAKALADAEGAEQKEGFKVAHEIGLAKVPLIVEHVKEALEDQRKIILFAHHLDVIAAYMSGLQEYRPVRITGDDSLVARQQSVDTFQRNPLCKVIVAGIEAAKEGLTLTAASHVIFGELSWVPGTMCQCEDRAHRIGQTESVLVQHFVLEGSADVRKVQTLVEKQEVIEGALNRRSKGEQPTVQAPQRQPAPPAPPVRPPREPQFDYDGRQMMML